MNTLFSKQFTYSFEVGKIVIRGDGFVKEYEARCFSNLIENNDYFIINIGVLPAYFLPKRQLDLVQSTALKQWCNTHLTSR